MKYKIIQDNDPNGLTNAVNEAIENGFEPIGGISHSEHRSNATGKLMDTYVQALVKKSADEKIEEVI